MNQDLLHFKLSNMKDLNIRRFLFVRRFLLLSGILLVVGVSIVLFALIPQLQAIVETQQTIRKENEVLQALQRKVRGLLQVNDLAEYAQKDVVDLALPSRKPLLPLLDAARRVSEESGGRITKIETSPGEIDPGFLSEDAIATGAATPSATTPTIPATPKKPTQIHGVEKLDVAITVQGTVAVINDFIRRIERTTPVINVTEVNMTDLLLDGEAAGTFSADLTLSTYYFDRPIEVAIDDPLPETGVAERELLRQISEYSVTEQRSSSGQVEGGGREDLFGVGQGAQNAVSEATLSGSVLGN